MPYAQDGSITYETIIARYNSDLANTLGNLVNRTVAMVNKYFDGEIQPQDTSEPVDTELISCAENTVKLVTEKMDGFRTADALDEILNLARRSNKYIDETMPWALAKDESKRARLGGVLYNLIESIRMIAVMLKPFMPDTAEAIIGQINAKNAEWGSLSAFGKTQPGDKVGEAKPLFERIDEKKKLAEIEAASAQNVPKPEKEKEENADGVGLITIDDFAKVELKVGVVLESKHVEGADRLLVSKIKIGDEVRQIVSGIAKYYSPEEFVGKKVAVVTNLKPVKLRGVLSEGMVLAASTKKELCVLTLDKDLPDGTVIS